MGAGDLASDLGGAGRCAGGLSFRRDGCPRKGGLRAGKTRECSRTDREVLLKLDLRGSGRNCLLLLVAAASLFFAPILALRRSLFFGDVANYALRLDFTGRWLRMGQFPLWNPYLSFGAPHAIDIGAQAFYPPHPLLAALLGVHVYDWDALLHVLLAAIGVFGLARVLDLSHSAALLGAIAYAFGGFTFGHLQHLNVLVAIAWIPIVLATTERYLATADRRSLGLAILAVGLLLLGGHPQLTLYGLAAQTAYCLSRITGLALEGRGPALPRLVGGLLILGVAGLGLAAVFLVPFVEWMRFVSRADQVTGEYANWYSLPWTRLSGLVAPFWLGGSPDRRQNAVSLVEYSSYVGLVPLALAAVAISRPGRRAIFFLLLGVVALALSLGARTPLFHWLLAMPVFASVRAPARFLVLVDLSVALLAAYGLDTLRAGKGRGAARAAAGALLLLAGVVARAAWLRGRSAVVLPTRPDAVGFGQPDTILLLTTLVGAAALLWALSEGAGSRRRLIGLTLVFATADVWAFRERLFFYAPAPATVFAEHSSVADAILRSGGGRFYTQSGKELADLVFRDGDLEAYRRQMWESLATSLPMRFGLQSASGYLTEPPAHALVLELFRRGGFGARAARTAGAFSVRWIVGSPIRRVSAPGLTLVARGVRDLYRNDAALPRAYLSAGSRVVASPDQALSLLSRQAFDPRQTVLLDTPGPPMPETPFGEALVAIVRDEPDRVVVATRSDRPAWLVLNDTFAPGWTAVVDGSQAPILRANALVRAVAIGGGQHRVEFVYAPASVRVGLAISLAALTLAAFLLRPGRRRDVPDGGP